MRDRRSSSRPRFAHRQRAATLGQMGRFALVLLTLAITASSAFFGSVTSPTAALPSAANPTSPAEVARFNNLPVALPNSKAEAAAFERLHHSSFNFSQTYALNQPFSFNSTSFQVNDALAGPGQAAPTQAAPTQAAPTQAAPPDATTPSAGPSLTPSPTAAESLSGISPGLTPSPTNSTNLKSNVSGAPTCYSLPGSNGDSCEPDNNPDQATNLLVNDIAQLHNFITAAGDTTPTPTPVASGNSSPSTDPDWFKFSAQAYVQYTLNVTVRSGSVVPSLSLFDPTASAVISTGVVSGLSTTILNFVPTSTNSYFVRVLPQGNNTYDVYAITLTSGATVSTPTVTSTPATTNTGGPTNTPIPCRDDYEDDNYPNQAKLLRVSGADQPPFGGTPAAPPVPADNSGGQTRYICPEGDIDWVFMDLVKGKPYSVFTTGLTGGLDTFMVLYLKDSAGNLVPLYSSDDYPGMGLASRIDWIVPSTSDTPLGTLVRYYLAIKDVGGHGALNLKYNLFLTSPGNGLGDCFDAYEPDNGPAQAKDILLNETQNHSFCPTGDRDWVKFFAKAGRVYNISTSFGPGTVGLDTSLYVWQVSFAPTDTNTVVSQSLIAQNDDRSDADLSSATNFSVPNDGIYYAEFRNAGDVGRNGLYYSVRFATASGPALDVPGTQTAAAVAVAARTQTAAAIATAGSATATATSTATVNVTGSATSSVSASATSTRGGSSTSASSQSQIEQLVAKMRFSDPGYQKLWLYSDLAVATGLTQRSWEWGPSAAVSKLEPYVEASGGTRQVQYFDKARMEINNPKGDHNSKWFISNGLLVKELVTGWLITGDSQAELHPASTLPVAGDLADSNKAPGYFAFEKLITKNNETGAADRSGQVVSANLTKDGSVSNLAVPPEPVKLASYIKETGHNIPTVFWSYLNTTGLVYDGISFKPGPLRDWVFSMGLPLSEPYWIKAQIGGVERDVLVQLYERRVLTYTPSNGVDWRVEMSNVGQHYYLWRYGVPLGN